MTYFGRPYSTIIMVFIIFFQLHEITTKGVVKRKTTQCKKWIELS